MSTFAGETGTDHVHSSGELRESIFIFLATMIPLSIGLSSGFLAFDNDTLYADVARTMVETGNWMMPAIHGVPFLDKPPLFFWLSGLSVEMLGDTTLAYRLPAALAAAATAGLMYFILRRVSTPRSTSIAAVVALLGCPLFFEYTRRAYMEVPVAGAVLASLYFFSRALENEDDTRAWLAAGLWTGLGFMLKSLVGLFGALGFGALILVRRRWDLLANRGMWAGLGVCALVCVPWHGYAYLDDPQVFLDFTYKLHVEDQVLDAQPWSAGPVWFYAEKLATEVPLLGLATMMGCGGYLWRWKQGLRITQVDALLLSALLVMLAVFSFSATKKVIYALAFTPVAFTLAAAQFRSFSLPRRWLVFGGFVFIALWTRNLPLLDPSADFLRGSEPYARAAKAIEGKHGAQKAMLVDQYFSAAQFYAGLPSTSVWTHERIVRQTQRIPYIRHGKNMVHVPREALEQSISNSHHALWFLPEDDARALNLLSKGVIRYQEGGLVVIESGPVKP